MAGYPIDLDMAGRWAVVVGLGAVGRRKAAGLRAAGARVRGVDPLGAAWAAADGVDLIAQPYRPEHLLDARLVIAAATPEVNRAVVRDAREAGLLVASASEPGAGDFAVPAVWRDGLLTLAIATGGASPALAGMLRDRAAAALGPGAATLARILADLRAGLLADPAVPPATRRQALLRAADPAWLDHLADHGEAATTEALRRALGLD